MAKRRGEATIVDGVLKIGAFVRFVPSANIGYSAGFPDILGTETTGTVVQINRAHHWYRVEYVMGRSDCIGYECFKTEGGNYHENDSDFEP